MVVKLSRKLEFKPKNRLKSDKQILDNNKDLIVENIDQK
jgi:hypothetical protein